ncbi:hypothetical protein, partial [Hymenobacter glacieicola]|uniref:hypothetical protein n=1 Tax=Hymenobacter glacieicola TaxID=1562124 RepID=UPI001E41AE82
FFQASRFLLLLISFRLKRAAKVGTGVALSKFQGRKLFFAFSSPLFSLARFSARSGLQRYYLVVVFCKEATKVFRLFLSASG